MEAVLESAPVEEAPSAVAPPQPAQAVESAQAEETDTPAPAAAPTAPADADTYTFTEMQMKVGDRAQLEPPQQTGVGRTPVRVVGWMDGQALIVTLPKSGNRRLALREGEVVLLRVFTGRRAFAFKSTVLKTAFLPFEHLHLSFPDRVEGLEVRNSHRCRVDLPATFTPAGGKSAIEGRIDNISTSGALIDATEPLGASGEEVNVDFKLELHGVPATLSLRATIRSIKSGESTDGEPNHQHGVEFKEPAPNDRLILGALVWYELHEHPSNAA